MLLSLKSLKTIGKVSLKGGLRLQDANGKSHNTCVHTLQGTPPVPSLPTPKLLV